MGKLLGFGSIIFGIVLLMIAWNTPVFAAQAPLIGGAIFVLGGIYFVKN